MGDGFVCYAEFNPAWGLKAWVTWVFVSVYAIPFLLLTFCYARICHVVWISADSKQSSTWGRMEQAADSKRFLWRISFR
jgi:hypothetical protein